MTFMNELFSLGGAMARGLARAGAKIGVLGRREQAEAAVQAITAEGGAALALAADVLNREQLEAARETVLERWGRLDILVNGAGGNMPAATKSQPKAPGCIRSAGYVARICFSRQA
jgi:NAD(P)-dependent dehydrogenase (short-subunit alcohol dehydrogenase family)